MGSKLYNRPDLYAGLMAMALENRYDFAGYEGL